MRRALGVMAGVALLATPAVAQDFPTDDATIRRIWTEGMDDSRAYAIGQALLDSLGPRLTGTPAVDRANDWAVSMLEGWGVDARTEPYGMWKGWERGVTHVDLVAPRIRTLDATLMAWSPGSNGSIEGGVAIIPAVEGKEALDAWLPEVRGNFVALARPLASCRPEASYEDSGVSGAAEEVNRERAEARQAWQERLAGNGYEPRELLGVLERAGARGVLWSDWSGGWGARRIFSLSTRFGASTNTIPAIDLSCEDYGLLFRLAERDQGPRIRVAAQARALGDVPVYNVIGELRSAELPDEYVVLSAHFDSWDGGSGATDNGTGTITMLEAMRILAEVYPNPRRTILVGLWASEEQGLNGSRAFTQDHPEVLEGLQAAFNQDNGTGRIVRASAMGLIGASENLVRWLSRVPSQITGHIDVSVSGRPSGGGSDHASFICAGAPTFELRSSAWDYIRYTWHTNLDTFDKIVWGEVKNSATLVAMLAYLAAEDERVPRERRILPVDPETGEVREWPECKDASRQTSERYR